MSDTSFAATSTTDVLAAWFTNCIAVPNESRAVVVGGARIHYLVWGAGDASKPVLLLVHGMLGHAHWWDTVAPYFADEYKVLAIDLSGMGDSGWRETYDGDTFTNDLAGLIEHESTAPVTIFGHSFGGSRALLACATRPELFHHAVIIDSAAWMTGEDLPGPSMTRGARIYPDRDSALARFRLAPEQPVCTPLLRAHLAAHSLRRVEEGWTWKFDLRVTGAHGAARGALHGLHDRHRRAHHLFQSGGG